MCLWTSALIENSGRLGVRQELGGGGERRLEKRLVAVKKPVWFQVQFTYDFPEMCNDY